MKLRWLSILVAVFLLAAPTVSADDGSVAAALQNLIDQIVAIVTGGDPTAQTPASALNGDYPEHGLVYPPSG
jgi:type IV secretory pathway VirB2 component (pilin)